MVTASTKEQFRHFIEALEKQILAVRAGPLADQIKRKHKVKKIAKYGGISLAVAGVAAIPFTAGLSSVATVAGLTIGTVTISATELAIICGTAMAITGVIAGARVTIRKDVVIIEPKYR